MYERNYSLLDREKEKRREMLIIKDGKKNVKYEDIRERKLILVEYKRGVLHSCNIIRQTNE